jgi:co-chaperonin GroES (HSP10)
MITKGKLIPIRDHVIVEEMEFGEQISKGGIIIQSDDGKTMGVKPRWGKVYAVGHKNHDVKVGDWVLIEHGRWTRGMNVEDEDGKMRVLRRVDKDAIMITSHTKPGDVYVTAD